MKFKLIACALLVVSVTIELSSCSGCVKNASKKAAELAMDAVDGATEAVGENGGKVAEKVTDAAGNVLEGVGKGLEKNADKIGKTAGKTVVKTLDGLLEGFDEEMSELAQRYDTINYTSNAPKNVTVEFVGRKKHTNTVDTYIMVNTSGKYSYDMEALNAKNEIIFNSDIIFEKTKEDKRKHTIVSFTLDQQAQNQFKSIQVFNINIKEVKE